MGESRLDTDPFSLAGDRTGCLLIHGFTATPYDMRFFGEELHRRGCSINAVRLAGHGTHVRDLERRSWVDWYDSARAGLDQLARATDRRVVIGQSMGALLALKLAHDHPEAVDAVVLISTALVAANPWLDRVAPVIPWLAPLMPARLRFVSKGHSDIADQAARQESPTYRHMPLRAIHQLHRLQRDVRPLLTKVRQPALAIHSRQDHACPLANVDLLERGLGGPVKKLVLDDSFHVVSVDVDKQRVVEAIWQFVSEDLSFAG